MEKSVRYSKNTIAMEMQMMRNIMCFSMLKSVDNHDISLLP